LEDARVGLVVQRGVDAMTLEDGEAEAAQRITQLDGEGPLVGLVAVEHSAEVAGGNARLLVEGLGVVRLCEVVFLGLLDLVVPAERRVRRLDALCLAVAHGASPGAFGRQVWRRRLALSTCRRRGHLENLKSGRAGEDERAGRQRKGIAPCEGGARW